MEYKYYRELSEEQVKRINILKVLFAIFVVYIHIKVEDMNFANGTYSIVFPDWFEYIIFLISKVISECAVPGFFFISSFLLYRKEFSWKGNMKKRLKTILVPYILMNLFWILAYGVGQMIPQARSLFANQDNIIADFTLLRWLQAFGIGYANPFLYPLWFLRNLFVLNVLAIAIKKIIDIFPKITVIVLVYIFLFVPDFPFHNFEYLINPLDFCMWCLGYYCVKYDWKISKWDRSPVLLVVFLLSIVERVLTKNMIFLFDLPLQRIGILVGLLFWYCWFSSNVNGKIQQLFLKVSSFSFGIYLFHEMNLTFCKKVITKVVGYRLIVLVFEFLFIPVFIIFLSIIICVFLKKKMPLLYSIVTGARN